MRTLVTRRWRMTISHGDAWGELYDLENDPHEMDNLFDDPAHRGVRGELMEKLAYRRDGTRRPQPAAHGARLSRACGLLPLCRGRLGYVLGPSDPSPESCDVSQAETRADAQHLCL